MASEDEGASTEPRPVGRPTKYKAEYAEMARKLCLLGATDREMANIFGVCDSTLSLWKNEHQDFSEALAQGKAQADANVAARLYERALGYEHEAVKIFMPAGADAPVYAPYIERYAPDTQAATTWLRNRQPEKWRDPARMELTGKDGGPIETRGYTVAPEVAKSMDEWKQSVALPPDEEETGDRGEE